MHSRRGAVHRSGELPRVVATMAMVVVFNSGGVTKTNRGWVTIAEEDATGTRRSSKRAGCQRGLKWFSHRMNREGDVVGDK